MLYDYLYVPFLFLMEYRAFRFVFFLGCFLLSLWLEFLHAPPNYSKLLPFIDMAAR
jgi:hypothetical protein